MLGHDSDKCEDANLEGKHLEGEALLIVGLGSRHLPVHQPDRNVLIDLMMINMMVIRMMMILIVLTLTLFRVTMKIKLRVAAVTEAIKRA